MPESLVCLEIKIIVHVGDCKQRPFSVDGYPDKFKEGDLFIQLYRSLHDNVHYYDIMMYFAKGMYKPNRLV